MRQKETRNRERTCRRKITVTTHNAWAMVVDGTHGVGRAIDILSVYGQLGCDVIGLQEARRSGHTAFIKADYLMGEKGKVE